MAVSGLTVSFDWRPFIREIRGLTRPALDRPVALALADTAKAANSRAARAIASHTGLKRQFIEQRLYYDKIAVGQYEALLRSSRKLIPLIRFGARETARGVRAAKPYGRSQVFASTFIATAGGHVGVWRRVGKPRLPIQEMMGPSVH